MTAKRHTTRLFAALALAGALSAVSIEANAQGTAAAEALFQEGRKAMSDGNLEAACRFFRESSRLDRTVGTLYNLADCEEQRGNVATSWQLFGEVVGRLPRSDDRRAIAEKRRNALTERLPKIVLRAPEDAPIDLSVKVGEVEFRQSSFGVAIPVDPGPRTIVVEAAGRESNEIAIDLAEGAQEVVEAVPGAPLPDPEPETGAGLAPKQQPVVADASREPEPTGMSTAKILGFVAGGIGVAGLATGGTFGLLALKKEDENLENCFPDEGYCNQKGLDAGSTSKTYALISTIGFAVGGVGLATGAYLIFFTGDDSEREVALVARPRSGGATMGVRSTW